MRRTVYVMLWLGALMVWCVAAIGTAPPHFMYRVAFLAVAGGAGVLTYWWPRMGWMYTLALIPVANLPARALAFGAHEALVFVALACALGWWVNRLVTRQPAWLPARLAVPTVMLLIVAVSSGVWTALRYADFSVLTGEPFRNVWVNTTGALDATTAVRMVALATLRELVLPAMLWVSFGVMSEDEGALVMSRQRVIQVWSIALVPVIAMVLYQSHFDPHCCMLHEVAWTESGRVSGGMSDPNALGLFIFLALPMLAHMAWRARGLAQLWFIVLGVCSVYALGQSGSRSGMLGIVVVGAVVAGFAAGALVRRGVAGRRACAAGAGVLVLAVFLAAPVVFAPSADETQASPLARRMQAFVARAQSGAGTSVVDQRELQWQQALQMWQRYPLTGVGVGAFAIELPNQNRAAMRETPIDNAWNQYLQWLAELGLVGLALWVWWIGAFARAAGARLAAPRASEDLVALLTLAVFAFLCIFGAHLQAAEVACGVAVVGGMALAGARPARASVQPLSARDVLTLGCAVALVTISQAHYAARLLSCEAQQQRYALPAEFGLYHIEDWQGQFTYQWSQKYGGRAMTVPESERVMVLRLAAFDPDISPQRPKQVKVRVNGILMDTISLTDNNWNEHEVYIYNTPAGAAELSLECDRVWRPPHEVPPRTLGVAVAAEIGWRAELGHESQGLSAWYEDAAATPPMLYRWTEARAARMMTAGKNGVIRLRVRTPAPVPFYRDAPRVTVFFNNDRLGDFALPRTASEWHEETVMRDASRGGQRGILSVYVSRLSRVHEKGRVRARLTGMAMAEIETE